MTTSSTRAEASKRVIDETRRLYANLLSHPLDERQLVRPTFKFIQEVTKSLITETKTLRNVFNPSDFDTQSKSWDKRRRTEFVQKLIDFAANHKQPVVGCVAAKLVAGLEPNKGNELLQALAKIAHARVSGQTEVGNRPRTFTKTRIPSATSKQSAQSGRQARAKEPSECTGERRSSNKSRPSSSSRQSPAVRKGSGERARGPADGGSPETGSSTQKIALAQQQERAEESSSDLVVDVTNDEEMSKHIQVLQMNLSQFIKLSLDINQIETTLKTRLAQSA